jgi:hypothetical protein
LTRQILPLRGQLRRLTAVGGAKRPRPLPEAGTCGICDEGTLGSLDTPPVAGLVAAVSGLISLRRSHAKQPTAESKLVAGALALGAEVV